METLLVERPPDRPGLMIVTLNRPAKLNAITPVMHQELQQVCLDLQTDAETRVVILTGSGRAFSAGADLYGGRATEANGAPATAAAPAGGVLERRLRAGSGNRTCALLERLEQVTIGAINGLAVGGAVAIAASLDIRLAAE
jgi:enoyl-CoA hydratase/carnithine racemase